MCRFPEPRIFDGEVDDGRVLGAEKHDIEREDTCDRVDPGSGAGLQPRTGAVGEQGHDHGQQHHLLEHVQAQSLIGEPAERRQQGRQREQRSGDESRALTPHDGTYFRATSEGCA